jgi:hypothetical protein
LTRLGDFGILKSRAQPVETKEFRALARMAKPLEMLKREELNKPKQRLNKMAKKENHMEVKQAAPAEESAETVQPIQMDLKKTPELIVKVVRQAIPVEDLQTQQKVPVNLVYNRYVAPTYDEKEYGGTLEQFNAAVLKAAAELVQPIEKHIDALLRFATSEGYQTAKVTEMGKGDYLTPELKTAIATILAGKQRFAEMGKPEIINYWKERYFSGNDYAVKVFAQAKEMSADADAEF